METLRSFSPLTVGEHFDLCVVGGGLAGTFAAIAAAREGLSVLIVEKYGFLGGMACTGLINPFMKFYERGVGGKLANAGLFRELLLSVHRLGGSKRAASGSYMEEFLKLALDRMCAEAGVRVLFHAQMNECEYEDGILSAVTVGTVSGNIRITSSYFVDGTGNGDLSAFAGIPYRQGREEDGLCQPMTLCFRLANVDRARFDSRALQTLYTKKRLRGEFINPRENVLFFHLPVDNIYHFNTTRIVGKDPVNVFDLSDAEREGREQVYEMYRFMKECVPGMENAELIMSAPEIGVRESRRIVGLYEMTQEDVLGTRKFDDRIARGTYDIDIHNPAGTGTVIHHVPDREYYTIPYRSLVPVGAKNLLVAGRPISTTHEAHSSIRVMPITSCIGEAAGAAIALAKKSDAAVADIEIKRLQDNLTDHGALI